MAKQTHLYYYKQWLKVNMIIMVIIMVIIIDADGIVQINGLCYRIRM